MITEKNTIFDFMRAYRPDKSGVAFIRGAKKFSYPRFFKETDRVAAGLAALGINKGDVVMIALPTIEQGIVAFYAVSRIGAVASMIHPLMERGEFLQAVEEQKPKAVFLSDVNFAKLGKGLKSVRKIVCPFGAYGYIGLPRGRKFSAFSGDGSEPAVYMRSGGTSGVPKTVVLSAAAVNALTKNLLETLSENNFGQKDRMLVVMPMFHGFGLLVGLHSSICTDMPPVIMPVFKAERVVKAIARHRITTVIAVPRMINKLLNTKGFEGKNVSCLENVYVGGDAVDAELEKRFDKRMKEAGSSCVMSPGYGLTETGSVCVLSPRKVGGAAVGKPLLNMKCRIVLDDGSEAAPGEVGELLLAGNQMMTGYLGDDKATQDAFTEIDGEKWLKTGDYFKASEDGVLYFAGRKKRLIKISGMNVFPSEIERVTTEEGFAEVCAAIEVKVQEKPFIALFIEGKLSDAQIKALKERIVDKLSRWHEPRFVICLNELPRTNIGKMDYVRLSNEFESCCKESS